MKQMVIEMFTADTLPKGYLPCARPDLVEGYVSIEQIFKGRSVDFGYCWGGDCNTRFCKHNLDVKREDTSYLVLLEHFLNGGAVNQPINYVPDYYNHTTGTQHNGHHRLVAAYDAGFTHVPYNSREWGDYDWNDTPAADGYTRGGLES